MHVLSPLNQSYNTSTIDVWVQTEEMVPQIKYAQKGDLYFSVCSHCTEGTKKLYRVNEGIHKWRFLAKDYNGNPTIIVRQFTVDFTSPVIHSVYPPNGFYFAQGANDVTIEYSEINPQSIKMFHKKYGDASWTEESFTGCPAGEEESCTSTVTLNYPEDSNVEYYFEIKDAYFTTVSDMYISLMDTQLLSDPIIVFSPTQGVHEEKRLDLTVVANQPECDEIGMVLDGGRARRLCSRCTEYDKVRSFTEGQHTLRIDAECGGILLSSRTVDFEIETILPKISTTLPRDGAYAKGDF